MIMRKALPRRTFLKGMGTAIALPFLDAMTPALASSRIPGQAPVRMGFVYVPNGMDVRNWNLDYEGKLDKLSRIMQPLERHKQDLLVLGNLTHNNGRALLDGPGDHGRCCGSYLTGIQPRKSAVDIKVGISMDQIVANQIGHQTRFPSLNSAWRTPARLATVIRATPVPTPITWHGGAKPSRCRRFWIQERSSNASSAPTQD